MSAQEMGSLNLQASFRDCLVDCIRACSLSRWEIAGTMSNLLDTEVTIHMINAWTAESKDGHRFPAEYLPAFCKAVGSYDPLDLLVSASSMFLMPGEEVLGAELARVIQDRDELNQKIREMKIFLKKARL